MKLHSFEIKPGYSEGKVRLFLDGHELKYANEATIRLKAGKVPQVTVKVWAEDVGMQLHTAMYHGIKRSALWVLFDKFHIAHLLETGTRILPKGSKLRSRYEPTDLHQAPEEPHQTHSLSETVAQALDQALARLTTGGKAQAS